MAILFNWMIVLVLTSPLPHSLLGGRGATFYELCHILRPAHLAIGNRDHPMLAVERRNCYYYVVINPDCYALR